MEFLVLGLFVAALISSVIFNFNVVYALCAGYVIFFCYSLHYGFTAKEVLQQSWNGILKIRKIFLLLIMVGALTASWRECGTIAGIVCYVAPFVKAKGIYLMVFLMMSLVSSLTGSSVTSAATMGTICVMLCNSLQLNPLLTGGVVLSGALVGDRLSPIGSAGILAAEVTQTDVLDNFKNKFRTSWIPFLITCALYLVMGLGVSGTSVRTDYISGLMTANFDISIIVLIPAAVVFILVFMRVPSKWAMLASSAAAVAIAVFLQHDNIGFALKCIVFGYSCPDPELANLINGGGLVSQLKSTAIICISASFTGIFESTGIIKPLQNIIQKLYDKHGSAVSVLCAGICTSIITCSQLLAIILAEQLVNKLPIEKEERAMHIENSATIFPALVPWSLAAIHVLSSAGANNKSMFFAFYAMILVAWQFITRPTLAKIKKKRTAE